MRAQNDEQMGWVGLGWVGCMYLSHATLCKNYYTTSTFLVSLVENTSTSDDWSIIRQAGSYTSNHLCRSRKYFLQTFSDRKIEKRSTPLSAEELCPRVWPTCSIMEPHYRGRGRHIVISRADWAGSRARRFRGRHMDRAAVETHATRLRLSSARGAIGRPAGRPTARLLPRGCHRSPPQP